MEAVRKSYLELHLAVLLFGLTAILGDLIRLSSLVLVWWRVLLASLSLYLLIHTSRSLLKLSRRRILIFLSIGLLVGLHWLCFFGAIKLSNASITLVCMATSALFTAFLEPYFFNKKIHLFDILLALLVIPGMVLVVRNVDLSMFTGVVIGLVAAFLAALFSILNKKYIQESDALTITFLEMSSAWILMSVGLVIYPLFFEASGSFWPTGVDWIYIIILAILCTTLGYVLALRALRHLSAFAASLTLNLEPVYGILLAWVLLKENKELTAGFYLGVCMILFAVFTYPVLNNWAIKRKQSIR